MNKPLLVGEIGINHNGDINIVKRLIDQSCACGLDYIKFQKRTIEDVYTKEELDKYRESPWGTTNREQKYGLEFEYKEYKEIDNYCKKKNIKWFSSPWDVKSVGFLENFKLPFIKVAAASITNEPLLERIKYTDIPVIMSCGMSDENDINRALDIVGDNVEYLLSCTSSYPTTNSDVNLKRILTLKEKYGNKYKIGFSNHSTGIPFIIAAMTLGAEMVEFHITLDRSMYGSDQKASIEKSGIEKIVDYINAIYEGWGDGEIKCLQSEEPIREKLRQVIRLEK